MGFAAAPHLAKFHRLLPFPLELLQEHLFCGWLNMISKSQQQIARKLAT